jgi:hypothetical protein
VLGKNLAGPLGRARAGDRERDAHEVAQGHLGVLEGGSEEVVAGRVEDREVEGAVLLGIEAAALDEAREFVVTADDLGEGLVGVTLGGEGGGLALDAEAELLIAQEPRDVGQACDVGEIVRGAAEDVGAAPAARLDEAVDAEMRDRLAHDRAGDAEAPGEVVLAGQTVAGREGPAEDLVEDPPVDLVGEARRSCPGRDGRLSFRL